MGAVKAPPLESAPDSAKNLRSGVDVNAVAGNARLAVRPLIVVAGPNGAKIIHVVHGRRCFIGRTRPSTACRIVVSASAATIRGAACNQHNYRTKQSQTFHNILPFKDKDHQNWTRRNGEKTGPILIITILVDIVMIMRHAPLPMNGTGADAHLDDWLTLVAKQAASLRFGTIQIIVHDSKVVQVERTEKFRLDNHATAKDPIPDKIKAH